MLLAAAATIIAGLSIVGIPLVNACAPQGSGLIACLRDLADRKFDLPGDLPSRTSATASETIPTAAAPVVVVDLPPPVEAPPSVAPAPELATGTSAPLVTEPEVTPAPAPATETADTTDGQGGPLLPPRRPDAVAPPTALAKPAPPVVREAAIDKTAATPAPGLPPAALPASAPPIEAFAVAPIADESPATVLAALPEPAAAPATEVPIKLPALPPLDPRPAATLPVEAPTPADEQIVAAGEAPLEGETAPSIAAPVIFAPTIDAIELEGPASYISGSGPTGAIVRLYSDGKLLGESPVEDGRWLVEAGEILGEDATELRVEALEADTGRSLGNSVITVEIEHPQPEPAPPSEPQPPLEEPVPAPAPTEAPPTEPPVETMHTPVEAEPEPTLPDNPQLPTVEEPPAIPDQSIDDDLDATAQEPIAELTGQEEPEAALPALAPIVPDKASASVDILPAPDNQDDVLPPAGTGNHEPSTIELDLPDAPALMAEFTVPTARSSPSVTVLRLFPFGDPVYGRFSGGQAIIRRGDTLWSLARRYYGAGIHYRTIFDANRAQIARPSRIYPGQIFDLPLVTNE